MAEKKVTPALDHAKAVEGLAVELVPGKNYSRVVLDGKTIAYLNGVTMAVKADAVDNAPKGAKLPAFTPEKSGRWTRAHVDTDGARHVLEFVVGQAQKEAE